MSEESRYITLISASGDRFGSALEALCTYYCVTATRDLTLNQLQDYAQKAGMHT